MRNKGNIGDGMYLHVLGSGSAQPKPHQQHSSQVLRLRDKTYMIDCGEGAQLQMMRFGVSFKNLHRIFISHLHGDHCLGLPGLLSTMSMTGLDHPVHIYGPEGIEQYIRFIIDHFAKDDEDRIIAHVVDHKKSQLIYEDNSLTVRSFPLKHRMPTVGYRFDEKPKPRHLNRDMADFYGVPVAYFGLIKQGKDFVQEDGMIIPNERLTLDPRKPYSYAYCSDTAYSESVIEEVRGVDLLYHETTFEVSMAKRAKETQHSTTIDAAAVAQKAQVGHLLIGHYSARYSTRSLVEYLLRETSEIFPRTIASEDGMFIDFEELRGL